MFPQATSFLVHKVVLRLGSRRIFFLTEVLLFCDHTDSPVVGASDISFYVGKDLNKALNQDTRR